MPTDAMTTTTPEDAVAHDLPRLLPLTAGTFAVGTGLLVIQGVLPDLAADIGVAPPLAGQLVTVFAVVYAVTAPVLATAAARFGTRPVLVVALLLFAGANVLAAVTASLTVLVASRVVAALGAALFTPVASAAAALLVAPEARGRALAIVYGGLSFAMVLGVPVGTLVGQAAGWRSTFWLVAGLATLAAVALIVLVPTLPAVPAPGARAVLRVATRPAVLAALAVMAVMTSGQFVAYTFVAAVTEAVTGTSGLVALALFVFGVFAVTGNFLGGALTDRWGAERVARRDLALFVLALLAVWVAVLLGPSPGAVAVGLLGLAAWGVTGWAFNPPQQRRLLDLAPTAAGVALAANASALYLGIAVGSAVGGAVYTGVGVTALPVVAASFVALALIVLVATTPRRAALGPGPATVDVQCVAPCGPMPATGPPPTATDRPVPTDGR